MEWSLSEWTRLWSNVIFQLLFLWLFLPDGHPDHRSLLWREKLFVSAGEKPVRKTRKGEWQERALQARTMQVKTNNLTCNICNIFFNWLFPMAKCVVNVCFYHSPPGKFCLPDKYLIHSKQQMPLPWLFPRDHLLNNVWCLPSYDTLCYSIIFENVFETDLLPNFVVRYSTSQLIECVCDEGWTGVDCNRQIPGMATGKLNFKKKSKPEYKKNQVFQKIRLCGVVLKLNCPKVFHLDAVQLMFICAKRNTFCR